MCTECTYNVYTIIHYTAIYTVYKVDICTVYQISTVAF